jgi:hypothetical protein
MEKPDVRQEATGRLVGSPDVSTFEAPPPDLAKIVAAWESWELGEEAPGKVLANMKTAGLADVLRELVATGWTPGA